MNDGSNVDDGRRGGAELPLWERIIVALLGGALLIAPTVLVLWRR